MRPWPTATLTVLLWAGSVHANVHTWDVSEVFSNADGSIQFIELREVAGSPGETAVGNGMLSSDSQSYSWSNGLVESPTTFRYYLVATPGFAALPGAPTPDALLPPSVTPFFSAAGDTVAFFSYDVCTFGAIPTDGIRSYDCLVSATGTNSPTNYAGETGTVDASPATPIPAVFQWSLAALLGALLAAAAFVLHGRRAGAR